MALQGTDLFVVQNQTDKKLYSLKVSELITEIEAGSGAVNFRGGVDLNYAPSAQDQSPVGSLPNVALPAGNGDLYVVMVNCPSIAPGWVMQNGETSALKGDRIVYDGDNANWILLATEALGGTMTGITATLPLKEDGDKVNPVISILEARTNTAATLANDGEGTDGAVHRLAEESDVNATTGTGDPRAVVTADLLKETNDHVAALELSPGGVISVTTDDVNNNDALSISPTTGAVKIEIETASVDDYGVVQIASESDVLNGNSGAGAIIDASQLKEAIDNLPSEAIVSITEDGTSIVSGALEILTTARVAPDNIHEKDTKIGVKTKVFCPYDFSSLQDISFAPNP
jgi:hypothetical protein